MLCYIMGKSGSGKDMIYRRLLSDPQLHLKPLVMYTTRPIRSDEIDGRDYHFTDEEHLQKLLDAGKVIELRQYHTMHGLWSYFTVDDEQLSSLAAGHAAAAALDQETKTSDPGTAVPAAPGKEHILGIGTLQSWKQLKNYYGESQLVPVYLEVEDGLRLSRALKRERKQKQPKYEEMCRRFLADQEDFSEERLKDAGITKFFQNNLEKDDCFQEVKAYLLDRLEGECV